MCERTEGLLSRVETVPCQCCHPGSGEGEVCDECYQWLLDTGRETVQPPADTPYPEFIPF